MSYKVEQLNAPLSVLGEGPHWDAETNDLYYIDIYGGTVNRYCMTEDKTYSATIGEDKGLLRLQLGTKAKSFPHFQKTNPSSPSSSPWTEPRTSLPSALVVASE